MQDSINRKATKRDENSPQEKYCRMLQMLIKSTKEALGEMESHCVNLLEKNRSLVQSIKQMDLSSVMYARDVLDRYNMTEKSTMSMQEWNQWQEETAKQDLKEAEEMVEKQLGELQRELHELDIKMQASQAKLQMLRAYKDKEFPGKMLRTAQLQREVQELKFLEMPITSTSSFKVDGMAEDMAAEVADNTEMYKGAEDAKIADLLNQTEEWSPTVSKGKMKHFPANLMNIAALNHIMTKENELRKQIIKELKSDISYLLQQQLFLVESRRQVRQEIFADVLLQRPKCTPDMEIVLDIPLQEKTIL
uniref:Uncharacterized protein C20orf96 homolog n=1 Tax=Geotrypetes seraphini TaxID=260995 RepID=A0A6P8NPX5_GEOSA|nr:uncharacterized protein C20orf96 homolog [Geotrypetes seraphini]